MWVISNVNNDVAKDLGLMIIKKYWRCTSQISEKWKKLHRDYKPVLTAFVTYLREMHNNEEVTENIKIRWNINSE